MEFINHRSVNLPASSKKGFKWEHGLILALIVGAIFAIVYYFPNLFVGNEKTILGFCAFLLITEFVLFSNGIYLIAAALFLRGVLEGFTEVAIIGSLNPASVLGVAVTFFIILKLVFHKRTNISKGMVPFIALLGWSILITLINFNPVYLNSSVEEIIKTASSIVILVGIVTYGRAEKNQKIILAAILLSSIPAIIYGLTQIGSANELIVKGVGLFRLQSFFPHPNNYAHFLMVMYVFATIYPHWTKNKTLIIVINLLKIIIIGSVIATFSRSGIVGLIILIFILNIKDFKSFVYTIAIIGIIAAVLLIFFGNFVSYTFNITLVSDDLHASTLASRYEIWGLGFEVFKNNWLIGVGPGVSSNLIGIIAHNDYLRILWDYGIPGLLIYLWGVGYQILISFRLEKRASIVAEMGKLKALAKGSLAVTLAVMVVSSVGNIFNSTITGWCLFALLGLVMVNSENIISKL
jgi:O-antigen ligase